tara:strand:+ start:4138 stop:4320 length:183 start_codon:yes stop_codon:yes gene_type:complete
MPTFDDSKFSRAQERFDGQEPPEDDLPTDEDIFDKLWGIEGPQTPKGAEMAINKIARSIK